MKYPGRYFEEFHPNQEIQLPSFTIYKRDFESLRKLVRTQPRAYGVFKISPEDVYSFSKITGDWNALHGNDSEFHALVNVFKRPIVHGLLTVYCALRSINFNAKNWIAGFDNGKFLAPADSSDELWADMNADEIPMPLSVKKENSEDVLVSGLFYTDVNNSLPSALDLLAWSIGVAHSAGVWNGTCLAFLGFDKGRMLKPVNPGEALWPQLNVLRKEDRGKRGAVTFLLEVSNSTDTVFTCELSILLAKWHPVVTK